MFFSKNLKPKTHNLATGKGPTLLNLAKREFRQRRNYLTGFTIVELIVVIAVIGILYTIVIGSVSSSKAKSRDIKRIADISVIQLALERYYDEKKMYPASLSALYDYDKFLPATDPLGNGYLYAAAADSSFNTACNGGSCQYYHLGSKLELYNSVLTDDADKNSSSITGGFNGADDTASIFVYDVVPKF